jgi:hypothetical protein
MRSSPLRCVGKPMIARTAWRSQPFISPNQSALGFTSFGCAATLKRPDDRSFRFERVSRKHRAAEIGADRKS